MIFRGFALFFCCILKIFNGYFSRNPYGYDKVTEIEAVVQMAETLPWSYGIVVPQFGWLGRLFGRNYRTKPGAMGKHQPINKRGEYLSPKANPFTNSPVSEFAQGVKAGYADSKGVPGGVPPVGVSGNIGYVTGQAIGYIF